MNITLRQFLDSLPDWVWEMDIGGVHTYSNGAVKDLLGYEPEELLGKHVSMFWPEDHATPEKIEIFNQELQDGEAWQQFRGRFRHKAGHMITLESSGDPLFDMAGKLVGFRGIDRDISPTLKFEDELKISKQKYKELSEKLDWENNFKTLLLDLISHDILNPANVISGFSEMLLEEFPDNEMIAIINSSSHGLMEVIDNARALTQISLGKSIETSPRNLTQLLEAVVDEFKTSLDAKGINLNMQVDSKLLISVNPIITEVFKNYISNALKYADGTQTLTILSDHRQGTTTIEVRDEGETISELDRQRIFERGVQMNKSRGGDGLGLAIVERIAVAHGAEVGVRPLTPKGNAFYINFPDGV